MNFITVLVIGRSTSLTKSEKQDNPQQSPNLKYFIRILINYHFSLIESILNITQSTQKLWTTSNTNSQISLYPFMLTVINSRRKLSKQNFNGLSADIYNMVKEFQLIKKENFEWLMEV